MVTLSNLSILYTYFLISRMTTNHKLLPAPQAQKIKEKRKRIEKKSEFSIFWNFGVVLMAPSTGRNSNYYISEFSSVTGTCLHKKRKNNS